MRMPAEIEKASVLRLAWVKSKKSPPLFCTCMKSENHHDSFDIGAKCNGGTKASLQKGSDGLIHRYYFSYFIHPELFSLP